MCGSGPVKSNPVNQINRAGTGTEPMQGHQTREREREETIKKILAIVFFDAPLVALFLWFFFTQGREIVTYALV